MIYIYISYIYIIYIYYTYIYIYHIYIYDTYIYIYDMYIYILDAYQLGSQRSPTLQDKIDALSSHGQDLQTMSPGHVRIWVDFISSIQLGDFP